MALILNGSRQLSGLNRIFGGVGAAGLRSALDRGGVYKNFDSGEHAISGVTNKASVPEGTRHPFAWRPPTKAGSLSSHNLAGATITSTGTMLMGYPIVGETTITISTNTPTGQLISSGSGSATLTISTNTPLLTASIGGSGSATITIDASVATLGAIASVSGETTLTFTTTATILPIDDTSPARTASATMSFSGTLTPYAIGNMIGSTLDSTVLTADIITSAVWEAVAADHNDVGSMGAKLNSAASGGVDYGDLANAVWTAVSRTLTSDLVTPEDIAAAVLAELSLTTIPVNITKVNNVDVDGAGTELDPWGPV